MNETKSIPVLDLSPGYKALESEFQAAIARVLESGQFIMGPDVAQLESELAAYLGVAHVIGVNSGTDALVISLRALGIGSGDEVITTPFTFFATAEAIEQVGARPVFCDVSIDFNIDVTALEKLLTPKTRAILPVHLYGRPADMTSIAQFAKKHGLVIVEDCAQSFGATIDGKQTGTFGNAGAFSFFPSKTLGAFGDGGCIATNDDAVAAKCRALRAHGSLKKYYNETIGYNSRLDTLQAAILRVKLPHIDEANRGRRRVAAAYNSRLKGVDGVTSPEIIPGHVFHQYTIRISGNRRDLVKNRLADAGISTMVYYPVPIHKLPIYGDRTDTFPISEQLASEVLSLPIWPELPDETIEHIVNVLKRALD